MPNLEDAILLAIKAHRGQKDKAGAPYILHPLRIMLAMETETEMIVAVLHDVVEDGGIALDDLRKDGYSAEIIDAVDHLTHRDGEDYDQFIDRVKSNPLAVKVKVADLKDNSNLARIAEPNENDYKRLEKYQRALRKLMSEDPDN
jgi:(p)ppGpp synthase/HD superfamily hydrolase